MGMTAERLNLRCFVDGIEIPVIGTRCTYSEGSAASAEIQVVPSDMFYDIEPRSFVTLYTYDSHDYDRDPSKSSFTLVKRSPYDLRRWKLLFAGEYIGMMYQKQAGVRAITMMCVDHTNYWDFIRQHAINFSNGGIELFENAFMGVKIDRIKNFDVVAKDQTSNLYVWLMKSKGPDGKPNLYMGVQRMLREMWFAANDFYARAFNRLRLGDQLVGIAKDRTAAKLFSIQFFEKWIKNQVGGSGGMTSVRQMIELMLNPVFHNYVTVPFPMFDRKGLARGFSPDGKSAQDLALMSETIDRSHSWEEACLNYTIIKPDSWFFAPPACNVVFPHQYTSLSFQRNFLQEPTRLFLRTSLIFTGTDKWLTERFYAPDFEAFNKLLYKKGGYLERLAATRLPHEEFVGINPAETWQSDLSAYAQKGGRRDYLGKVADYLFWKMRFGMRNLDVSGPLNTNIVPGYPGVVLNSVGSPGEYTRHYVGQIQTVSHVVNQQQGGWTHFSMSGVHIHDETADFDDKGRSLEEVTSRGTDGFIDNIYDFDQIGKEVYQTLFGCNSIYDVRLSLDIQGSIDDEEKETIFDGLSKALEKQGAIAGSVTALSFMYQQALKSESDLNAFTQSITWRPKANLLEMMGTSIVEGQASMGAETLPSVVDLDSLQDPELVANEGFFASSVDPESKTITEEFFIASSTREVAKTTITHIPPEITVQGGKSFTLKAAEEKASTTFTSVTKNAKGKYGLGSHLEARRAKVQAYLDSLRLRGIRG